MLIRKQHGSNDNIIVLVLLIEDNFSQVADPIEHAVRRLISGVNSLDVTRDTKHPTPDLSKICIFAIFGTLVVDASLEPGGNLCAHLGQAIVILGVFQECEDSGAEAIKCRVYCVVATP